uniref:Putative secreted protein n=1 Tax=Amblyomma triste TaxID=251400 RepID=A0A023G194_AMBTT
MAKVCFVISLFSYALANNASHQCFHKEPIALATRFNKTSYFCHRAALGCSSKIHITTSPLEIACTMLLHLTLRDCNIASCRIAVLSVDYF